MWSLKIVKGAELADALVTEWCLPQPLKRVTVGRDPSNDWLIADRTLAISARHCEIVDSAHGPVLRDLSTNGTFVNGAATRLGGAHLLRDGDRVEMGPFDVLVSGPPMPERPALLQPMNNPLPSAPVRSPGAQTTAPHRGGDPAAMLARGAAKERAGLTEILRAAPASLNSGMDLTRIRAVPPAQKLPAALVEAVAAADGRAAVWPTGAGGDLAQALARGLGVPLAALEGRDLLQLVEQLAAAARSTQAALGPLASAMKSTRPG